MILDDHRGNRVELRLEGYQFPHLENDRYDSNWVRVHTDIATPAARWEATDPCLLTEEVGWLRLWLRNVANGVQQTNHIDFMEPYLIFRMSSASDSTATIQVTLSGTLAPPWGHRNKRGNIDEPATIELTIPRHEIAEAATDLQADLNRYPPRAGQDTRPPFTPRSLLPHFICEWLLAVRTEQEEQAMQLATEYMSRLEHPSERGPV